MMKKKLIKDLGKKNELKLPKVNGKEKKAKTTKTAKRDKKEKKPIVQHGFSLSRSIRMTLIVMSLIPVILIVLLGITSYKKSAKGLIENYENSTESNLTLVRDYLQLGFKNSESKANIINTNETIKLYYAEQDEDNDSETSKQYNDIANFIYSNASLEDYIKNITLVSKYNKGVQASDQVPDDAYQVFLDSKECKDIIESKSKKNWIGSHKELDEKLGKKPDDYCISNVSILTNTYNEAVGYIIIDVSAEYLVKELDSMDLPEGSITGFVTSDGRETFQSNMTKEFTFTDKDFYKRAITSEQGIGDKYVTVDDKEYLFVTKKLDTSNGMICALVPRDKIIEQANEVRNLTVILIIVASIIAIGSGTIISNGITKAIHKTNHVLEKTAQGDMTATLQLKRRDEFQKLSKEINNTVTSIRLLISKMVEISNTVSDSSTNVFVNSDRLLEATKNITDGVAEIESGVTMQAQDAESCFVQMSTLAGQITNAYTNANEIEKIASDTKSVVSTGIGIMDELSSKTKDTTKITDMVIDSIQSLEKESSTIGGIVSTINDLAEQSSLLSLNASIEAARAGESGRGFMVVAEEIRKLADQSAKSADQIRIIIEKIQVQTKKTVETAKEASTIVNSQEDALGQSINIFSNISTYVENLTMNIKKISETISIIEHSKDGTLHSIENISATSEETAAVANELGLTAKSQLESVEKLHQAASELEQDAVKMQEAVQIFKI